MRLFAIEGKRESSELIFIESADEVLKEAVALLKKCADSIDEVFGIIDVCDGESDRDIIYKLTLLKAFMQTTKLGAGTTEADIF